MDVWATKILLILSNPDEAASLRGLLVEHRGSKFEVETASDLNNGVERLSKGAFDIVLLGLEGMGLSGPEAVARVSRAAPTLPILVMVDQGQSEEGLKAVQAGAQECWVRGTLDNHHLPSFIRYAIKRKQIKTVRDDFFSTIGHDINTPISVIREGVAQVLDGLFGEINEDQRKQLAITLRNVDWLKGIVNELLGR